MADFEIPGFFYLMTLSLLKIVIAEKAQKFIIQMPAFKPYFYD